MQRQWQLWPTTCRWGNVACSAIAAVGQPCLERQLCFALPPAASGIMRAVQCRDDLSKRGRGRADERITSAFCATRKQIMPAEPSWFIEAANFAIRFSLEAKRFYERKRAKTNAIVAFKAIAHKLARCCKPAMGFRERTRCLIGCCPAPPVLPRRIARAVSQPGVGAEISGSHVSVMNLLEHDGVPTFFWGGRNYTQAARVRATR